jgi:hypothetical protein
MTKRIDISGDASHFDPVLLLIKHKQSLLFSVRMRTTIKH